MGKRFKLILFAAVFIMSFILSSCGAKVSTVLTLNEDFSGQRVITLEASKSDVSNSFKGGIKKVDEIFAGKIPPELTYVKSENSSSYIYTVTLDFASLEDYRKKVQSLLGREAQVEVSAPESVFASGISISEDFNSTDLMGWFRKVVVAEELMSNVSDLWELAGATFVYGDKSYNTSEKIAVTDIVSTPLDKIVVNTRLDQDLTLKRTVNFHVPAATYNAKTNEIRSYLESLVPEAATSGWHEEGRAYIFSISYISLDTEEFIKQAKQVFDTDTYEMQLTVAESDSDNMEHPFMRNIYYEEFVGLASFQPGTQRGVSVEHTFSTGYTWGQVDGYVASGGSSRSEANNVLNMTGSGSWVHFSVDVVEPFRLDNVLSETTIIDDNTVSKIITFVFASKSIDYAPAISQEYFERYQFDNFKTEATEYQELPALALNISGSGTEVTDTLRLLFGEDNYIYYSAERSGLSVSNPSSFNEQIDLSLILSSVGYESEIGYTLKKNKNESTDALIAWGPDGFSYDTKSGRGKQEAFLVPARASVSYEGRILNAAGIIFVVFLSLLGLAAILAGGYFALKRLAQKDGLDGQNFKEILTRYLAIFKTKSVQQYGVVKDSVSTAKSRLLADPERSAAGKYFYGTKLPLLLGSGGIFLLVLRLLIRPRSLLISNLSRFILYLGLAAVIAAIIWKLYERFSAKAEWEKEIDEMISINMQEYMKRGLERLGLLPEQVSMIEPIITQGPYMQLNSATDKGTVALIKQWVTSEFAVSGRQVFKYGTDGKVRYSLIMGHVFYFSETQVLAYKIAYDVCSGEVFEEDTTEYFYQDVDSVLAGETTKPVWVRNKPVKRQYSYFKVTVSSGESNYASVDAKDAVLENQIIAMKNLIRDKKNFKQG